MVVKFVLDTNAVIYLLGGKLAEPLPPGRYALSVISEMELLSYPGLSADEETAIRQLLGFITRLPLGDAERDVAIALRKTLRLKLPDAVIAASALNWGAVLLSNDTRLVQVPGLAVKALNLL